MKTRKLLFTVICTLGTAVLQAQTLHNIVFSDTNDKKIGESVAADNDRELEEIQDVAAYIGYKVVDYVYSGDRCNKNNLMKVVNSVNPGANDIVVFYYTGHGTHAPGQDSDPYPQLLLNSRVQSDFVPLRVVIKELSRKQQRLTLILSDCCNNMVNGVSQKVFSDMTTVTVARSNEAANYKRLFVESRGSVIATGCKLGQTSLGLEDGGIFSNKFWEALYAECSVGNTPSWLNVMRNASKETTAEAAKFDRHRQEPYFDVNVTEGTATPTVPVSVPAPVSPVVNLPAVATNGPLSTVITSLLAQQSTDARLAMVPKILSSHFARGGHVVTLGRDLQTIVDYEDAAAFFRRLATSPSILRINVIKEQTADGLPYITVTEMRRQ